MILKKHLLLAVVALSLSIPAHAAKKSSPDAAQPPNETASISILGTVVENTAGTALYRGNFVYLGHMKVQPIGSKATLNVLYLFQGPGDPAGAPAEIPATAVVSVLGSLGTDSDGKPVIVVPTITVH